MKKYAEQSEAKKKTIKIKRGPKKLNFGASKSGVGGGPGPLGPPLDPLVKLFIFDSSCLEIIDNSELGLCYFQNTQTTKWLTHFSTWK